jgi:hypothetical protein
LYAPMLPHSRSIRFLRAPSSKIRGLMRPKLMISLLHFNQNYLERLITHVFG